MSDKDNRPDINPVSTHASAREATKPLHRAAPGRGVSTHASAREAT